MNQILSVELRKNNKKRNKADIKSVVIFFAIFLIIFGLTTVSIGIYSIVKKEDSNQAANNNSQMSDSLKIDVSQNASSLEIEVLAQSSITSIQYSWNGETANSLSVDGSSNITTDIDVPSGTNSLKVVAQDANGNTKEFEKEYVGVVIEEPNIIEFKEAYNNDNIDIETGKHKLTIEEIDENGKKKTVTKTIYIPEANVLVKNDHSEAKIVAKGEEDGDGIISKIHINFNDEESDINDINSATFEKNLESKDGENRLIIEVYNNSGLKITKRIKWKK